MKVSLGEDKSPIYMIPEHIFQNEQIPEACSQNIEEHQIVKLGEGYERCLYFVSEEFYLKALRRITN